jgi:methylenetetrahydrofolate reductase (NADPH)
MKIASHRNISFEFFPPKTPEGMLNLEKTAGILSAYNPDFFSVTYGAGGSTRQGTLDTITLLQQSTSIPVAPHLACIGSSCQEITTILLQFKELGFNRVVALRGDMPSGMGQMGDFRYGVELVEFIRKTTGDHFHIEVAAYPEFHPHAFNAFDDVFYLKKKIEAGANSAITQYFYNVDAYFYFLDKCEKLGITVPIIPGIMPITHFEKLVRFSSSCGAEIPRWLYKRLESYADDVQSIKIFGLDVVSNLCEHLLMGGAPGLHFYTLNQADMSVMLLERLGMRRQMQLTHK